MANDNLQKLELTWIGKGEEPKLEPRILIENPDYSYSSETGFSGLKNEQDLKKNPAKSKNSVNPDADNGNMLIHGDNLLALKALEQDYAGKIKCIYIDPPYNTGAAFEHYDDGVEHSLWLSLMRPRLKILWELLDYRDGSIWISIDDNEMPYLKIIMDEICGRDSFIASNVWQKRYSRENREAIGDVHEYVLVYAKDRSKFKEIRNKIPLTESQAKVYTNPNNDPKGRWRTIPMTAQSGHATASQFYEIISPSGKIFTPSEGRCWALSETTFKKLLSEGRIYFGKNGDSQPNTIRYLSEVEGMTPWTWWNHEEVGHTDEAKKEQHILFGKEKSFDTPKPERLIERIIHIATNQGDLVLDSFLGSGTTAAVAHKMGRRWIGVELGEHAKTHCYPRLKAVVDGEQGGISKAVNWQGGGGFKFYTLAPSLLKQDKFGNWVISQEYNADMLAAAMAKQEGFKYNPHESIYWKQGQSSEQDFIFTTTQFLTMEALDSINDEMQPGETLLICCKSFQQECKGKFGNITIKKIPMMLLGRCEYGKEDYSLNIINMPSETEFSELEDDQDFIDDKISVQELADKKNKIKPSQTPSLFDDVNSNSENP
jgi:adenine-specific DNA-methyltransferase